MFPQLINSARKVVNFCFTLIIITEFSISVMNFDNNFQAITPTTATDPTPLEIIVENINGTSVSLSLGYNSGIDKLESVDYLEIRITYHLMLKKTLYLLAHDIEHACDTQTESLSKLVADSLDEEVCKGNVFMFGSYNDTVNKDYSHLFSYCTNRTIYTRMENPSSTIINDLLPNRPYLFKFAILTRLSTEEHLIDDSLTELSDSFPDYTMCTNNSIPLHPPQTDVGSFRIIIDNQKNHSMSLRRVELFLRPIPTLMIGYGQITYELNCTDASTNMLHFNTSVAGIATGKINVDKPLAMNKSYNCELRSKNALGYSRTSSIIYIPEQDRIINTYGKFNVFSIALSSNHYQVSWSNITSLLLDKNFSKDLSDPDNTIKGVYTLYWCTSITTSTTGCDTIAGMKKTTDMTYSLKIPGQFTSANFGVSYRSAGNNLYTGIIWTSCVANLHHSIEPLRFLHNGGYANHIELEWTHPCISAISLFQSYTIEYCVWHSEDPCSSQPTPNADYIPFGDLEKCNFVTIPNDLVSTNTTLFDLNESTRYIIHIRANVNTTLHNKWSEAIYVSTAIVSRSCLWQRYGFLVYVIAPMAVLGLLIYSRKEKIIALREEIQNLLDARASIHSRIVKVMNNSDDNTSEIEMKYWVDHTPENGSINELPFYSESEKGSNNCLNVNDKEDNSNSVPDYIDPIYLMNGQAGTSSRESATDNSTNSEKATDTDTDNDSEISIASHSSFINNLLRDD